MTEKLPGILAEIAALVGEAAALAIAARAGGTRVYFPARTLDTDHWLVDAVGMPLAVKLCAHFAVDGKRGAAIEIPFAVGGTYNQMLRSIAQRVHQLDAEGLSSAEIARKLGITQRLVHRHRASHRGSRPDDKQRSLF